jgi:ribonuclease HII
VLLVSYQTEFVEAGCDEAGRGCLAGPVFAAAVILPPDFKNDILTDSKKLNKTQRDKLRIIIEKEAIDFSVAALDNLKIDEINILQASILAMHHALDGLKRKAEFIAVDGNKFNPYNKVPHKTIVQGDGTYLNIAAASILAKTYRDEWMEQAHEKYPRYDWLKNKGYGTAAHRQAILKHGYSPLHRKSFVLKEMQTTLW